MPGSKFQIASVADQDPQDPYVLGPPGSGSGSISTRYGSGSGSFQNQAKIVRKPLNSYRTVLRLLHDFLSLKNDVNLASKSSKIRILPKSSKNSKKTP
jgi:hypothetical protein